MKGIHLTLTGLSLTILLLSFNRLTSLTTNFLQPYEFLRWLDFNAMIPIPLLSIILYYFLKRQITYDHPFLKTSAYFILNIIFITGVYFFGAGSGDHEVTNYLNTRFCDRGKIDSPICNIIKYNDDEFSHYVYYIGFILLNVALMFTEYNIPRKTPARKKDILFVSLNGIFIGLGIFANLAFEEIGLDLYFFGSVMALSLYLLVSKKRNFFNFPIISYFAISYSFGVLSTIIFKLIKL